MCGRYILDTLPELLADQFRTHGFPVCPACWNPASGYLEWRTRDDRQPFALRPTRTPAFAMAAVASEVLRAGVSMPSFAIVTVPANESLAAIHDRMPLLLDPEDCDGWLPGDARTAAALIRPAPPDRLCFHPVSRAVGKVRNDGPALIEAVAMAD